MMIPGIVASTPNSVAPAACDPHWNNVFLLAHLDTNFSDSKGGLPLDVTGLAGTSSIQISSVDPKFGDGSASWVSARAALGRELSTFNFSDSSFTIECQIYPASVTTQAFGIFCSRTSQQSAFSGFAIQVNSDDSIRFRGLIGANFSNNHIVSSPGVISRNTWQHIAFVRDGINYYLFVGGVLVGSLAMSGQLSNGADRIHFGVSQISLDPATYENPFQGKMDEIRVTKFPRYTESFTPPTEAFPNTAC